MRILALALAVPLALLSFGCHTLHETSSSAPVTAETADKEGDSGADEKETKADKVKKAERALDDARVELKIARQECEAASRKQKDTLEESEYERAKAHEALDLFRKVTKPLELKKLELSYDRSKNNVEEEKAKLEELLSMYRKEDFASATKELVLARGRKGLEFANRSLEHDQIEAAMARDTELPRKDGDLDLAVRKAENALREAKAEQAKLSDENELKLRKAERAVDDAEKDLAKQKAAKEPAAKTDKAKKEASEPKEMKDAKAAKT